MTKPIQVSLSAVGIILLSLGLAWLIQSMSQPADVSNLHGHGFDQQYIADMTVHHQGAIEMANLALSQGQFQPIKDLAATIIADQNAENKKMIAWRTAWGYQPAESSMSHTMHNTAAQLEGLSGNEFDTIFLQLMIKHHQMAIDMSEPARNQAQHQELKDLAEQVIQDQTAEIELMKQWQTEVE